MNEGAIIRHRFAILWLALALVLAGTPHARLFAAEPGDPEIVGLRVGFDTRYKLGRWTPVEITFLGGVEALTGSVRLILPDGDGTPSVVTAPRPVQILPGRRTAVQMYAKFGRAYGELRVQFRIQNKNVIDRVFDGNPSPDHLELPQPLQEKEGLFVMLGSSIGVEESARLYQQTTGLAIAVASLSDVDALPTQWYGYDGVDALLISTSQPDRLHAMFDTEARSAALAEWIEMGGKLILTVGAESPAVLAADAPLARFAPGQFVETTLLRRTTDLESFVGGSRKVRGSAGGLSLSVPRLEEIRGRIEVADGNLPLVVRSTRRFGEIDFVAVDLDRAPFVDWEGRAILVSRLLGLSEQASLAAATPTNQATANLYPNRAQDLLDRMRSGLNEFVGVTPISFAVVAAMIVGYILLIGPGDYFLVKRLLKRMELTWITFPIWVALVSAAAYSLAVYTKGSALRLNQVDLVDIDMENGRARGTSWLNVFSPQSQTFDLALQPQEPSGAPIADSQRLLAWLGSGGNQFGGGAGTLFAGQYEFTPELDGMLNLPIQVWSTKGLFARTSYQCRELPTANLVLAPDGVPEGTIRNELSIELSQCMLLSGSWVYLLGDLKPGDTFTLRPGEQRDLKHVLRHPDTWKTSGAASAAPPGTAMAIEALDEMLFFKAAGIGATAGRTNAEEAFVDLSDLLDANRAILLAYAKQPALQLTRDGRPLAGPNDLHWTVYRFIFPVAKAKASAP
ncbi:MAG TPA: hypothetical protein VGN12_10785 [Pirellulales bacterium]|jgi:hypothetical protein